MKACGTTTASFAAVFMLISMSLDIAATVLPWWRDSSVLHQTHMTLWHFEVTAKNSDAGTQKVNWSDYCEKTNESAVKWCQRIRANRATIILAAIFAFFSIVSMLIVCCKKPSCTWCGAGAALMSFLSAASSIIVGLVFRSGTQLKTPDTGFIVACVSAGLSLSAVIMLFLAACYCGAAQGFDKMDNNAAYKGWGSWRPEGGAKQAPPNRPPAMPAPVPVQYPPAQYPPAQLAPVQYPSGGVAPPSGQPSSFGLPPPSAPAQGYDQWHGPQWQAS